MNTSPGRSSIGELLDRHRPGYSLEQQFYTDPEVYALEVERIIMRNWILAGHASEWSEAGDFKVYEVAGESAIIVRGDDGEIRGFANVCRHRGSRVCLDMQGNADKFSCPYHGWTYDRQGNLTAVRSMPEGFDLSAHSLKPVSVGVVHGLVFVAFCDDPPGLGGAIEELAGPMAMFDFENLKVAACETYQIPANWKLSIENYQECYHCATAHPEYARMHTLMLDPRQRVRVQNRMQERMAACGVDEHDIDRIDTAARPGEMGYGYSRTAMFDGYVTGSRDGKPVAPLLGDFTDYDGGASDFTFGAFSFLLAYSDHVVAYVFTPVDMVNSRCEIYWLVRNDAVEDEDYDRNALTWLWDITTKADMAIIVNNAKGVHSRYYEPGPFSLMEKAERVYTEWILQQLRQQ
ncbi:MAG: aromatic ring-hydroxylating dioxygenase subunit alpha [Woeseiaceae bacterium]|nr:aromatic ring-hydroxylating dioxygenase subunit alpha [Woeseiaceae bacterium]